MSRFLAVLSAVSVLGIMGMVTLDVASRLLTGGSFAGAVAYGETLLVVVVAFGIAEGQRRKAHVAMEIVTMRMRARVAAGLRGVGYLLCTVLLIWMTYEGAVLAWESYQSGEYRFGLSRVPLWPARAALVIGLAVLTFEFFRDLVRNVRDALVGSAAGEPGGQALCEDTAADEFPAARARRRSLAGLTDEANRSGIQR